MATKQFTTEMLYNEYLEKEHKVNASHQQQLDVIKAKAIEATKNAWKRYKVAKAEKRPHDKFVTRCFVAAIWAEAKVQSDALNAAKHRNSLKVWKTASTASIAIFNKAQAKAEAEAKKEEEKAMKAEKKERANFDKTKEKFVEFVEREYIDRKKKAKKPSQRATAKTWKLTLLKRIKKAETFEDLNKIAKELKSYAKDKAAGLPPIEDQRPTKVDAKIVSNEDGEVVVRAKSNKQSKARRMASIAIAAFAGLRYDKSSKMSDKKLAAFLSENFDEKTLKRYYRDFNVEA